MQNLRRRIQLQARRPLECKERVSKLVPFYRNGTKHFLRLVVSPLSNRDENIAAIVVFSEAWK